jgi:PAS domain-containing protein
MGRENWAIDILTGAGDRMKQLRPVDLEGMDPFWVQSASLVITAAEAAKQAAGLSSLPAYLALLIQSLQTGLGWDGKGIYLGWWNDQNVCTSQNEIFCDYLGLTRERACAEWPDYVHPEDRPLLLRTFDSAFVAHRSFQSFYRLRHRTGEYRLLHKVLHPYKERDGGFAGYVGLGVEMVDAVKAA